MGKIIDPLLSEIVKKKEFNEDEYPKLFKKHRKKIEVLLKKKIEMEKKKQEQEEIKKKNKEKEIINNQIMVIENRITELNEQLEILNSKGILELLKIERERMIMTEIDNLQGRLNELRKKVS